jgi:hypothetical protein
MVQRIGRRKRWGAFDSAHGFGVRLDRSGPGNRTVRLLSLGRDASATLDSGYSAGYGFQIEGGNEITGIHVSDGDAGVHGILGSRIAVSLRAGWRAPWQHGDNVTLCEVPGGGRHARALSLRFGNS